MKSIYRSVSCSFLLWQINWLASWNVHLNWIWFYHLLYISLFSSFSTNHFISVSFFSSCFTCIFFYSRSHCFLHLPFTFSPFPSLTLTCRNKKSCSACLSLCSLSSCSWRSGGSCLMTSPRRGPSSCAEVEEEDEEEEDSPWCSLSSSSVSSGWLWCCLAGPEVLEPVAETWSLGLDII